MPNLLNRIALFCFAALLCAATTVPAQVLSSIYSFDNDTNDLTHNAGLLLSGNTLYGTALGSVYSASHGREGGDPALSGAVFKLNTDGTGFTNFYIFSPVDGNSMTNTDGANSAAQLVLSGNTLYGTAENGGFYAKGTVFAINTDGTGFTNLYNFGASGTNDGATPSAGLVLSGNTLYGATGEGGSSGNGTLFAIHTDGTGFTNLYNFADGGGSGRSGGMRSSLILSNNILYGTTSSGGSAGNGTVFALNADGTGFTNLHSFSALVRMTNPPYIFTNGDGANPQAGLVLSDNKLYGTTAMGGASSDSGGSTTAGGTVFALNIDGSGFTNLHSFDYSVGNNPSAALVLSGSTLYGTTAGHNITFNEGTMFAFNTDGTGFATLYHFEQPNSEKAPGVYTNADGAGPVGNLILSGSTLYGATQLGGTNGFGTVFALDLSVAPPTIQFTASPTNGLTRVLVQFNSPGVDAAGNAILAWNWNFGDGSNSVSTLQNPTHTYTNVATFLPTLTCINSYGENVIGSGPAIVTQPLPPIQFKATPTGGLPAPMAVKFSSPSVDGGSNMIVSWNWNFGDGSNSVSVAQSPSHTYTNGGTYFPTLICSNYFGDRSVVSGPAIVVINSILLNGGFETGNFTNWTLSGYTKSSRVTTSSIFAHSGKYGAGLTAPTTGPMGFLSQTFPTVSGASYSISFWVDSSFSSGTNDFQASWNGNVLLDETNLGSVGWTNFQLIATATGTNSTLQFGYLTSLYFGLDDVSVASSEPAQPQPQPRIASFSLSGSNLVLTGTGGQSGQTYFLLVGTNLTEPFNQWTPVATNAPGADGNFSITATNAALPKAPQRFYILQLH